MASSVNSLHRSYTGLTPTPPWPYIHLHLTSTSQRQMGVWAGSLSNLLSSIGPNRAIMRRMRSKMRKIRSKMRKMRRRMSKMRRRMSKMRTQCEDAWIKCEDAYPQGTLIYAARLAFLGHDSCICYGIFRKFFTSILHRPYIHFTLTLHPPSPHIDFLETNGCMGR
jgi:hypothetical protein